ncbi:MAG: hypothetical protein KGJ23_13835 [Euryarchaeota archaeon]|nr:hypothetical protein [Euryarchaeota archaeon]MDE2045992.1 hypothetical protein [Thermoplasmata archaeon]
MKEVVTQAESPALGGRLEDCVRRFGPALIESSVEIDSSLSVGPALEWLRTAQIRHTPETSYRVTFSKAELDSADLKATAADGKTTMTIHSCRSGERRAVVHIHFVHGSETRCLFSSYEVRPKESGSTVSESIALRTDAIGFKRGTWGTRNPFSFLSERSWKRKQLALLTKELREAAGANQK